MRPTKNELLCSPRLNGELWFLDQVVSKASEKVVIFDVGANMGEYSDLVVATAKKYNKILELHIFEPQNACYDQLTSKFSSYPNIKINNTGLSDKKESRDIYFDYQGSAAASLYQRKAVSLTQKTTANLETLENYITLQNISHIDLLKIDAEGHELAILKGCNKFLFERPKLDARMQYNMHNILFISHIQFEYGGSFLDSGTTMLDIYSLLTGGYYKIGKLYPKSLKLTGYHPKLENYDYANFVAVSGRPLVAFADFLQIHNIKPKGALHIGAHLGEEAEDYANMGVQKVIWIEGNPEIINKLKENINKFKGHTLYSRVISDKNDDEVTLSITNNAQSSSILKHWKHLKFYPSISVVNEIKLRTITADKFIHDEKIDMSSLDLLNLDIEGAELKALKGMQETLKYFRWIFIEVSLTDIYQGGARLYETDYFLARKGFKRFEIDLTVQQWGNALYGRAKIGFFYYPYIFLYYISVKIKSTIQLNINRAALLKQRIVEKTILIYSAIFPNP